MITLTVASFLIFLGIICFALAAASVSLGRVQLGWLGAFFVSLSLVFGGWP